MFFYNETCPIEVTFTLLSAWGSPKIAANSNNTLNPLVYSGHISKRVYLSQMFCPTCHHYRQVPLYLLLHIILMICESHMHGVLISCVNVQTAWVTVHGLTMISFLHTPPPVIAIHKLVTLICTTPFTYHTLHNANNSTIAQVSYRYSFIPTTTLPYSFIPTTTLHLRILLIKQWVNCGAHATHSNFISWLLVKEVINKIIEYKVATVYPPIW